MSVDTIPDAEMRATGLDSKAAAVGAADMRRLQEKPPLERCEIHMTSATDATRQRRRLNGRRRRSFEVVGEGAKLPSPTAERGPTDVGPGRRRRRTRQPPGGGRGRKGGGTPPWKGGAGVGKEPLHE
ncbi:hypothetical protein NWFMUON74_72320 (plasmid) [Nocardia wallacei]|uniref:Uncharacterized protein n=1 Tax=Nocardia wallacei TaxID=480035 RepID=A0A7G1KW22_9NOCA|nr:hypothetical protein NWFMUON74_72320 [Nocardia wallacei]